MKSPKKMEEGSPEEEATESSAEESAEDEGTQESEGVRVPEEFQEAVHSLLSDCDDKACLDYLRSCMNDKEDELRKAEMKSESGKTPKEYSTSDMPAFNS